MKVAKPNLNLLFPHVYIGISLFFILNGPSIKNFVPTEAFNVLPLLMLLLYILILKKVKYKLEHNNKMYILLVYIFFMYLFFYGLFNSMESFNIKFFTKYLVIATTMILSALLITKKSIEYFIYLSLFWALFMAFAVVSKKISLSNINYLQIGHPIAVGVIISSIALLKKKQYMYLKMINILLLFYFFSALSSLYGRSPLLFPLVVLFMLFILYLYIKNKLIFISVMAIIWISAIVVYQWILTILPKHIVDRILKMSESSGEEPRFQLWERSFEFIVQNPMGYGLESSWHLVGYTPHNFMLEVLLSSGVIGLLPFLALLILWFLLGMKSYQLNNTAVAVFGISLYYFFRFQIGGEIGSSYDFFIAILLSISYITFKLKGESDINHNPNTQSI